MFQNDLLSCSKNYQITKLPNVTTGGGRSQGDRSWGGYAKAENTILLTTPENIITYHNALCLSPQKFEKGIAFSFSWGHFNSQEKLKAMLKQNFGVTNKEHYVML